MVKRIVATTLIALSATALLTAAGCFDSAAQRRAEREILAVLPDLIGSAEKYEVDVKGSASGIMRGRFTSITVQGTNIQPLDLPPLVRMEALIENLDFDIANRRVRSSGKATWKGWMADSELKDILEGRIPLVSSMTVLSKPNFVEITGQMTLRGVTGQGRVDAIPSIRNNREIWLKPTRVESLGIGVPIPGWGQRQIENLINPVYVIESKEIPLVVERIVPEEGKLRLEGTFDPKALSERQLK